MIIGLISDTHSYIDDAIIRNFKGCDEIWHAGDIGSFDVLDELMKIATVRAVYGNIDDRLIRTEIPLNQIFSVEGMKIWMTHIGGSPGRYEKRVREMMPEIKPDIFISGHSHILKIIRDNKYNLLNINPGAAGTYGFHKFRTIIKMEIGNGKINDMKVIELGKRGVI